MRLKEDELILIAGGAINGTLINAGYQWKSKTPALIQMNSLSSVLLQETTNKSVTVGPFK